MRRCFLHVGFHKTATTSFQLTLQHNRSLLEQDGIYLLIRGKSRSFSANHSGQIKDLFSKDIQRLWNRVGRLKSTDEHQHKTLETLSQSD